MQLRSLRSPSYEAAPRRSNSRRSCGPALFARTGTSCQRSAAGLPAADSALQPHEECRSGREAAPATEERGAQLQQHVQVVEAALEGAAQQAARKRLPVVLETLRVDCSTDARD
jgi:hypothetical protein